MGGAVKALGAAAEDMLGRSVRVLDHFVVQKANHGPALLFEEVGSPAIVNGSGFKVLTSIQLDRKLRLAARKIDDVMANYELARKSRVVSAQPQPQQPLSFR